MRFRMHELSWLDPGVVHTCERGVVRIACSIPCYEQHACHLTSTIGTLSMKQNAGEMKADRPQG